MMTTTEVPPMRMSLLDQLRILQVMKQSGCEDWACQLEVTEDPCQRGWWVLHNGKSEFVPEVSRWYDYDEGGWLLTYLKTQPPHDKDSE
jgi:hypothetical protein